ncbi:DUF2303 family protein [Streptomyces sp. NRRL S-1022]|uniref:DUF2303 family protein n=1 Tax=Streptomyces sp. NRRL S-1022 TaxID=1463880 RepID=UPI0004BEEFDD|nr:DUF2303 family protein [Streptomyces sp. NRRL S-1022]
MTNTTDNVQAITGLAQQALAPKPVEPGSIYLVATADGQVQTVDLTGSRYTGRIDRKTGTTTVRDATSFLTYWAKHHDDASEVYSDVEQLTVTAVLNAHSTNEPDFGDHRLVLGLRRTKAWQQWLTLDGRLVGQDEFANFLEDHLPELVTPDAATMLEIAQSIKATTKAEFQSGTRLQSGERKFVFTEDTKATAGAKGDLTIPEVFEIAVPPFEGAAAYKIRCRFRYRIDRGQLALGFKLEQPEERAKAAFADVLKQIAEGIDTQVLNGIPA